MSTASARKRKRVPPSTVHQSVPPPHLIIPSHTAASASNSDGSSSSLTLTSDNKHTESSSKKKSSNGHKIKEDDLSADDVQIRQMEVDDLYHVWRLGESIFDREKMANLYRTWDPYCVTELFNTDSEFCLVAAVEDTDEIIGFAMGSTISKKSWKYGYLEWLGVAVKWQRFGIARKLFHSFRQLMQNSNARILIIDTQADNIPAINFFQRIGFANPHNFVYLSRAMQEEMLASIAAPTPVIQSIASQNSSANNNSATSDENQGNKEAPKSPAKKGRGRKKAKKPKVAKNVVIRNMELVDVSKIFHLGEKIFTAKQAQSHYRNWDEFTVVDFFNGDPEYCAVAEVDNKVVGFCLGTTIQKTATKIKYGYITWIGVQANWRRRGIGTKLYEEIFKRMVAADVRALLIDTQSDNKAALSFFEKHGFGNPVQHVYLDLNLKKFEELESNESSN